MHPIPMRGGFEYEALTTSWRGFSIWRAGERKAAKRSYSRRVRRQGVEI